MGVGLFDFFRRSRPRIDGLRLVVVDESFARTLRRAAAGTAEARTECGSCGSDLVDVIVATDLPAGSAKRWNDCPVVLDGWLCSGCSSLA